MKKARTSSTSKILPRKNSVRTLLFFVLPILIAVLPTLLTTPKLLLKDPAVWPDEPYFVSIAENIRQTGIFSMPLYGGEGIGRPDIRAYSYPPIYLYLLAGWIEVFGSSIEMVRMLSVSIGLGTLILFYVLVYRQTTSRVIAITATMALSLFGPFGMAMRVARMDIVVLFFILGSIYSFIYITKRNAALLLSSVLATMAFLTHPMGLLAVLIVLLSIVFSSSKPKEKIRMSLTIVGVGLVGILCWMGMFADRLDLLISQLSLQFSYKSSRQALITLLFERDLHWRITLLWYLCTISAGFFIGYVRKIPLLLLYSTAAFLTLITVIVAVDQWYFVFLPVFPILIGTQFWTLATNEKRRWIKLLTIIPLVLIVFIHTISTIPQTQRYLENNEEYYPFAQGISKEILPGSIVAMSAIPDPYFILKERSDITLYQVPHVTEQGALERLLSQSDILVYNFATNPYLLPYIASHTATKITIVQEDGYQVEVITLK